MNFKKSNNPLFREKAVTKVKALELGKKPKTGGQMEDASDLMTVSGAINKTVILGFILLVSAIYSYNMPNQIFLPVGALGAAAVFFITSWKPHLAPTTAPAFALLEGLFVGTISAIYAGQYGGIVFQSVSATIATLLAMLAIYKSGLIPVTQKFRVGVSMAVGAIMLIYLVSWVGSFVGFQVPYIHESTPLGIGITVVIIGIAALNLLLDFDNFEKGEELGVPKYMEWYYGMGLVFTIVWLYVEFLRLISKLQND